MNTQKKGMTGKDIITVGIFSAIYFVINFAFMLLSGLLLLCFSAVCIPCFGS